MAIATPVNLGLLFVYEPLRDAGVFDLITSSTIFRVVPLKRVRPPLLSPGAADSSPPLYQPITRDDEIRLLVLEPGAPGDELDCRLINVRQSWRTRYEALSYTWGDQSVTRPLKCSGHVINVTVNLHDALTDLRYRRRKRVLWVDAVCINQANNNEKSKQVARMGSIYSQARKVLIYLGKKDEGVARALQDMRWLDWKFMPIHTKRYCSRLAILGTPGTYLIERLPKMKPIPKEDFNWDQIVNLFHRPWFQRTWIIQEAILAKRAEVICGDESIPWDMLERVAVAMDYYKGLIGTIPSYKFIDDAIQGVSMVRGARRDRHVFTAMPDIKLFIWVADQFTRRYEHSQLLDMILQSRKFACTDPRDKIYGMLGVTNQDTGSKLLQPDYNLSKQHVYKNFVLWDILHNGSVRVLGCSWDKTSSEQASPSWVPDFTKLHMHHSLTCSENRARYRAGGHHPVMARVSNDGSVLALKGRIIDVIHIVGTKTLVEDDRWSMKVYRVSNRMTKEAIAIWKSTGERLAERFGDIDRNDNPFQLDNEAFLRALVCNRNDYGRVAPSRFLNNVSRMVDLLSDPKHYSSRALDKPMEAFLRVAISRHFAATELGLIGYVPRGAQKGDFVVIFNGASVPSVVRVVQKGKAVLIGECYMHGIMDGEAVQASFGAKEIDIMLH